MKRKILLVMLLGIGLIFSQVKGIYALYEEKPKAEKETKTLLEERGLHRPEDLKAEPKQPEYAPGQLIIKYKPEIGASAGKLFKEGKPFRSISGTDVLDNLNQKHKVKKIERVFNSLEVKGKAKGKEFLTAQEDAEEIKKKFPQRAKRAPKDAKIPDLENIYLLELEDKDTNILAIAQEYKQDPNVVYAEPNYKVKVQMIPNDPYYSSSGSWGQPYDDLWGLKKIQCEQAWDISQGEGAVVAVVDTGIDYNHENLAYNIWINTDEIPGNGIDDDGNGYIDDIRGWDFAYNDNNPMDGFGHGTHCAGTIAAVGNNGLGVIGVAPQAKVMALKGLDNSGSGMSSWLATAIRYAADNGADVISNSWGGPGRSSIEEDSVIYAHNLGCVIVAAAGNSNADARGLSPANIGEVITVSAFNHRDEKASFSNWGIKIDVAAPGGGIENELGGGWDDIYNILSTMNDNSAIARSMPQLRVGSGYYRLAGTSMACPHVSGLAALIIAHHPEFTNEEVRQVLRISADDVDAPGWDINSGYGRINAFKALNISSVCKAYITVPSEGLIAPKGTNLAIKGTASGSNFQSYELEYGRGAPPQNWILITSSQSPVENGLLGNLQLTEFGHYTIRLSVTDKSGRIFEDMNTVFAVADMQEGFPLDTGDYIFTSSPTVSDINEDGKKEILIGNYKGVYAYDYKGQSLPGWPIYFGPSEHSDFYTISVADLDPNYPGKEIAVTTYVTTVRPSLGYLHLYHADGTEITSGGWPKLMSGTPASASFLTTALADLDNDGELEIIQPSTKVIDVWKLNGGALPGWPKILDITAIEQPIAVGNIDDDPELEIVVVGWLNIPAPPPKDYRSIDKLFVLNSDGSYVNGFPMVFDEHCANAPVLADLDKDSRLEIIFQVGQRDVYAFKGDGTVLNGWPFPTTAGTGAYSKTVHPAIGDIDDDGFLEVIVCSGNEIFAINHDGSLVEGWPALGSNLYFNPVIGDIDGDGDSEILANSFMPTEVHAWHHNGQIVEGFPIPIEGGGYIFNSPAIADLDNDLDMELIVAPFTGYLYVYDFQEKYPEGQLINEWPMFNQSPQHTGNYPSYSNRPPVLDPIGNKTIDEDKLLQFLVSATDPDGDQLTYSAMDLPQGANFYPTSQTFSWIPTYSQAGAYNVTFSVSDGKGGEDSETITITVNNVNRAPVLEPIGNKVVNTGELLSFAVTATDPDGSILTYSASNLPSGATFNKATRVFSWTPSRSQAGTYQVHFEVTDGEINDSEDITITVTWLNHPPVANNQSVSVVKNTPKNIVLAASDPDADPLTYIVVNPPAYGILSGNAPALTYQPQTGYAGSDSFTFKVRDGQLDSNVATVSITVNSAPVANNQAVILAEDTSQAITLIATDADGDSLTYNIMNNPIHGKITGTAPNVIYTPQANYFGTDSFTFRAYDGKVYSNTATVSITVNNINDPPVLADIGNKTVNEGVRLSFSISASDADRDVLTYSAANLPAGAIFTASTRSFSWTPAFDQADTYSLTFNVSDGKGGEDSETITITVNNVNHAPVLAAIGNKTLYEGKLLSFTASASDADNDPLVYSATGIPPGATFDPLTRVFSWAPNFSQAGTYYVNFMVKDNLGVSDSERITITVYNTFLTGIVRDGKTKAPLSQVSVEVFQKIDRSYVFVTLATTDAQGRYVAEKSLSAGRYMLRVSADGYVTRTVYFSLVAGQTATVNINLGYPRYLRYRR